MQITASAVWGKVWTIAVALLCFGMMITVHEVGHFVTAKLFHVKVNAFAIGMGPAIFKRKRGETEYALRLIPMGGYVQMEGEDEDSADENAFNSKPVWQRLIVLAAGAFMNVAFGVVLVALLLGFSQDLIGTTKVARFYDNAVSAQYGLQEGDEIVKINGRRLYSERDLGFLMLRDEDGVLDLTVRRGGELAELNGVRFETREVQGRTVIVYDFSVVGEEPAFGNVFKNAFTQSASMARMVYLSLFDMVTGRYGISELAGPIGTVDVIADAAQSAAEDGNLEAILTILALISINLGIANLLPLPALDGGRIFFLLIEAVRRKPVNPKYEGYVHAAGFMLLIALMLVVTYNDIVRIVKGG